MVQKATTTHAYRAYIFRAEGPIPVIGDRSVLLPDHYSVADGALFIILIKTMILHFSSFNTLRRAEFRPQIEFDHVQH